MAPQLVSPEKRYRISLLLDTYGELLTDKQRTFLRNYYEEDLSFGEIAQAAQVSRQAIFDSVKHGEASLENYERVLGLVRSRRKDREADTAEPAADGRMNGAWSAQQIAVTSSRLRKISDAVNLLRTGSGKGRGLDWVASELEAVTNDLNRIAAEPSGASSPRPAPASTRASVAPEPDFNFLPQFPASLFKRGTGPEVD